MSFLFRDRNEGGTLLAERLGRYAGRSDALVVAIPRGGLPVGLAMAGRLGLPFDVIPVQRIVAQRDGWRFDLGALCGTEIRRLDPKAAAAAGLGPKAQCDLLSQGRREWARRVSIYRGRRRPMDASGRSILLVDDGISTGATMRAAIAFFRRAQAKRIVVAAPTMARAAFREMGRLADEVEKVILPEPFGREAAWYADFTRLDDVEAKALWHASIRAPAA